MKRKERRRRRQEERMKSYHPLDPITTSFSQQLIQDTMPGKDPTSRRRAKFTPQILLVRGSRQQRHMVTR